MPACQPRTHARTEMMILFLEKAKEEGEEEGWNFASPDRASSSSSGEEEQRPQ